MKSRKRRALRKARKNRLADLGQMASHVAHEVRNNLVPVTLYLSLLRRRISDDSGSVDVLDKVAAGFTALDATVVGTYLTIWPDQVAQPNASSLNPSPGQPPVPNAVSSEPSGNRTVDVAWQLAHRRPGGYYGSLVFGLVLVLLGPISTLVLEPPNYVATVFTGLMPAAAVLFTLISMAGFQSHVNYR